MPLDIVADENVDCRIIRKLRLAGYHVYSILEEKRGLSDQGVIKEARKRDALLLTEDSDFGEWVFVHRLKSVGIIFLRYPALKYEEISASLSYLLESRGESLVHKFVVITPDKVRIRNLP